MRVLGFRVSPLAVPVGRASPKGVEGSGFSFEGGYPTYRQPTSGARWEKYPCNPSSRVSLMRDKRASTRVRRRKDDRDGFWSVFQLKGPSELAWSLAFFRGFKCRSLDI